MKKKEMLPLTNKGNQSYHEQNTCYICKKEFKTDHNDKKTIKYKVRDHYSYTGQYKSAAYNVCNLRQKIPKEIPVVFQNGFKYDFHFIIIELAK